MIVLNTFSGLDYIYDNMNNRSDDYCSYTTECVIDLYSIIYILVVGLTEKGIIEIVILS